MKTTILFQSPIINLILPISVTLILGLICCFDRVPQEVFKTSELGRSIASNEFKISSAVYFTSSIPLIIDTLSDNFYTFSSLKAKWLWFGRLVLSLTCLFTGLQFQFIQYSTENAYGYSKDPALAFSLTLYGLRSIVIGALVGPLVIRHTRGMGRGLFLTEKVSPPTYCCNLNMCLLSYFYEQVKAGTLLLVERAFSYVTLNDEYKSDLQAALTSAILTKITCNLYDNKKLSYLYSPKLSTNELSTQVDIRWFLPSYMASSSGTGILAFLSDCLDACNPTSLDTFREHILSIIKHNSFDMAFLDQEPSADVRESIIKTLQFLCSDVYNDSKRRHEQPLEPLTELQHFILYCQSEPSLVSGGPAVGGIAAEVIRNSLVKGGINLQDALGLTALHYAALTRQAALVGLLLAVPEIDCNLQDAMGFTALHYAVMGQHYDNDVLSMLLRHPQIRANCYSFQYNTPLSLAHDDLNIDAIKLLLAHGGDATLGHPYPLFHSSPMDCALDRGPLQLLKLYNASLRTANPSTDQSPPSSKNRLKGLGLFLLTSFLNHSADDPTAIRIQVGEMMFVYALSALEKNTELLITYSRDEASLRVNWGIMS